MPPKWKQRVDFFDWGKAENRRQFKVGPVDYSMAYTASGYRENFDTLYIWYQESLPKGVRCVDKKTFRMRIIDFGYGITKLTTEGY
eukprot:SAG11_NODE_33692_length_275_cov_159.051136_1_plen_85_part_01